MLTNANAEGSSGSSLCRLAGCASTLCLIARSCWLNSNSQLPMLEDGGKLLNCPQLNPGPPCILLKACALPWPDRPRFPVPVPLRMSRRAPLLASVPLSVPASWFITGWHVRDLLENSLHALVWVPWGNDLTGQVRRACVCGDPRWTTWSACLEEAVARPPGMPRSWRRSWHLRMAQCGAASGMNSASSPPPSRQPHPRQSLRTVALGCSRPVVRWAWHASLLSPCWRQP